ncbi:hypothetical protein MUN89_03995 [Halobacillus salinarum]|uniref:Uncharacterized protein n=1 Tax=Halobacillus salinarum TaxID=2932257 RepID=A0ABY4EKY0_9BACI|nr:hypothetical protein [Halobacillus salinarum]UOQ45127.1 hypothetical protein MUN89_03995 [Halobacillus salinarum]
MEERLKELQDRVPERHKDLAKYTEHVFEAVNKVINEHRRVTALNATAGIKPDGEEERNFYRHMNQLKQIMLAELEKTVEDIEHKGYKNWEKHYEDGVDK